MFIPPAIGQKKGVHIVTGHNQVNPVKTATPPFRQGGTIATVKPLLGCEMGFPHL